jgi:hypothetical protein
MCGRIVLAVKRQIRRTRRIVQSGDGNYLPKASVTFPEHNEYCRFCAKKGATICCSFFMGAASR